jgi:predicted nucleic acid-binding protein
MGVVPLPAAGVMYVDAVTVIYTVERYPLYWPLVEPLWKAVQAKTIEAVTSELTLLECLVKPLKTGDAALVGLFERALLGTDIRLVPISHSVLREAAQLRAATKLKTPDAIHAATARQAGCALFVTNDAGFRGLAGLPVAVLDDYRTP